MDTEVRQSIRPYKQDEEQPNNVAPDPEIERILELAHKGYRRQQTEEAREWLLAQGALDGAKKTEGVLSRTERREAIRLHETVKQVVSTPINNGADFWLTGEAVTRANNLLTKEQAGPREQGIITIFEALPQRHQERVIRKEEIVIAGSQRVTYKPRNPNGNGRSA